MPPAGGTVIKYIDFPPEPRDAAEREAGAEAAEARRAQSNEAGLRRRPEHPRHPGMHETDTVDYAIVLSGEIYAILDEDETLMKAGDVLIQNATMHAWANRSQEPCRVVFVLVDGRTGAATGEQSHGR
jgi:quercetin dioxygenase-like cupin family protein